LSSLKESLNVLIGVWSYINVKNKSLAYIVIFLSIISAFLDPLLIYLFGKYITIVTNSSNSFSEIQNSSIIIDLDLRLIIKLGIFVAIFSLVVKILLVVAQNYSSFMLVHNISTSIFEKILRQDANFYSQNHSARYLGSLIKIQTLGGQVINPIYKIIAGILTASSIFIVALYIVGYQFLILSIIVTFIYLSFWVFSSKSRLETKKLISESPDKLTMIVQDSVGNFRDLFLIGSATMFNNKFRNIDKEYRTSQAKVISLATLPRIFLEGVIYIALFIYFLFSEKIFKISGIEITSVLILGLIVLKLVPVLQILFDAFTKVAVGIKLTDDLYDLIKLEEGVRISLHEEQYVDHINIKHSFFSYDNDISLNCQNFEIIRGDVVGLNGKSGSGKSTFLDLISGIRQFNSGEISFGKKFEKDVTSKDYLLNSVALVSQKPYLFDSSIKDNILVNRNYDKDLYSKVKYCCEINEIINDLPTEDCPIGENGSIISGGQASRIAIARALYLKRPFLFLDEATSGLSEEMESKIIRQILANFKIGILIVSHRKSIFNKCNKSYKIENQELKLVES
jgi:ATP-binding cassette subfamily B protein